jgi:EmrB/QacA subfamily drug resistance transporter
MEATPPPADAGPATWHPSVQLEPRARFEILGAILLALLLGALDQTIVGVALPRIVADLSGTELYTWTVTIYLLTSTISVPFWGKLSDIYGRKSMLMTGIGIFLVGSMLCGLSQEMWQLILFRGIQGVGAGALFPVALAVIGDLFSPAERGKYQGLFAAVFGFSALIGPALGGFLTDTFSWHAIFYINVPVGLLSLVVIARVMPPLKREGAHHDLDVLGAAVFTAAVAPILIGLTNARDGDWLAPEVGGLITIGLAILGLFLLVERRATEPIIPLHLFRGRTYSASIAATFFASFGFFAAIVFLPLYFQVVLGRSATESGYLTFPLLIGVIGSSVASGALISKTGRYKALILGALGLVGLGSFMMTNLAADTPYPVLAAWMFVLGLGVGPTLAAFTIVVQNAVQMRELGAATSSLTFFRQIGGSVGLAIAGSWFASRIDAELGPNLLANGVPAPVVEGFTSRPFDQDQLGAGVDLAGAIAAGIAGLPLPDADKEQILLLVPNIVAGIYDAMSAAIASVFWLGVASAVVAFAAAAFIDEIPLKAAAPAARPATETPTTDGPVAPAGPDRLAPGLD